MAVTKLGQELEAKTDEDLIQIWKALDAQPWYRGEMRDETTSMDDWAMHVDSELSRRRIKH